MKKNLFLFICFIILIGKSVFAQTSYKITLNVCIDGNSKLHIKGGKMFWEHLQDDPPGTHVECTVSTTVNGKPWKDWKLPFKLDFNTDSFSVAGIAILKNETSKMIQAPSAANGWETIWWFNDPSAYPHSYSAIFELTPIPKKAKPITAKPISKPVTAKPIPSKAKVIKKDTLAIEYIPNNINFETGNAIFTKESLPELAKIYESLKGSTTKIEISGHTTNVGEKDKLQKLSEDRALAVYNYFLNKGIAKERMSYHGYGDTKPIASNDTEEGKLKNRRVEIKILK